MPTIRGVLRGAPCPAILEIKHIKSRKPDI